MIIYILPAKIVCHQQSSSTVNEKSDSLSHVFVRALINRILSAMRVMLPHLSTSMSLSYHPQGFRLPIESIRLIRSYRSLIIFFLHCQKVSKFMQLLVLMVNQRHHPFFTISSKQVFLMSEYISVVILAPHWLMCSSKYKRSEKKRDI